jgi:molybdenum cofactor cytidylyltransferase
VRGTPPRCEALLLLLADQAAVSGEDLRRLFAAWRRHPVLIAGALHGGAPGLPAIFPRWAFTDLLELRGDRDAGQILRRNVDRVVRVPMPNAGLALDTPEDLLALGAGATTDERSRGRYHLDPPEPGRSPEPAK